ncbi:MAG: phospholipid-binding protein MlaC [Candidatus Methylomirabilia bacterium]
MTRFRQAALLLGILALFVAREAWSASPTEQLKSSINKAVAVLQDPALKENSRLHERRSAIREIANNTFDFRETAKRSLARHWRIRTPGEQDEFVEIFGNLLERSYFSRIDQYGGERITYQGERIDGDRATVRSTIVTKQGTDVPVDYRMLKRGDRWLVYDVIIEGVSLVSNYRTQFNKIIRVSSYEELMKRMKAKQAKYEEKVRKARESGKKQ